jgi:hypothetical protein
LCFDGPTHPHLHKTQRGWRNWRLPLEHVTIQCATELLSILRTCKLLYFIQWRFIIHFSVTCCNILDFALVITFSIGKLQIILLIFIFLYFICPVDNQATLCRSESPSRIIFTSLLLYSTRNQMPSRWAKVTKSWSKIFALQFDIIEILIDIWCWQ